MKDMLVPQIISVFFVKSFVFEEKVLSLRHQSEITRINEYEKDPFIGITGGRNRCKSAK